MFWLYCIVLCQKKKNERRKEQECIKKDKKGTMSASLLSLSLSLSLSFFLSLFLLLSSSLHTFRKSNPLIFYFWLPRRTFVFLIYVELQWGDIELVVVTVVVIPPITKFTQA